MVRFQLLDFAYGNDDRDVTLAGSNEKGEPCLLKVKKFMPYVLVVPKEYDYPTSWEYFCNYGTSDKELVADSTENKIVQKQMWPLCGYQKNKVLVLQVFGIDTASMGKCARRIQTMAVDENNIETDLIREINFEQQFYIQTGVSPCSYFDFPGNNYSKINDTWKNKQFTKYECDISEITPVEENLAPAPTMMCVFDLECNCETFGFPNPENELDYCEQIGMVFQDLNGTTKREFIMLSRQNTRNCPPKELDVENISFSFECFGGNERSMLLRFVELLKKKKTCHLIAHNGLNFDIPFLVKRAILYKIKDKILDMSPFDDCRRCYFKEREIENNQLGKYKIGEINPFGIVVHDTLIYFRRAFSLSSYKLNSLADHFLGGRQKLDVKPREMFRLFQVHRNKDRLLADETTTSAKLKMEDVAKYCMVDCILTLDLVLKVKMIHALYGLSCVTVTGLQKYVLTGEQRKSFNVISKKATEMNYFINKKALPIPPAGYQGATVLDASVGFHEQPILGLDFASLYPSIMQAYNLCFSTCEWNKNKITKCKLLNDEDRKTWTHLVQFEEGQQTQTVDVSFVQAKIRKGVLPTLLEDLLNARRATKKKMKAAKTEFEKMIYDQLQQAYKISCNSIYGFCGVTGIRDKDCLAYPDCCEKFHKPCSCYRGLLANFWIAQTVTQQGRTLISETIKHVQAKWPKSKIVYGDTDSCYVNPNLPATPAGIKEAFKLGEEMANHVTSHFPKPIELEFEKIMCPFLQVAKKRYLYVEWEPGSKPKRGAKGVETERRDNSAWLRRVYGRVADILLPVLDLDGDQDARIDKDHVIRTAEQVVIEELEMLKNETIPLKEFVISKQLSGKGYKSPQIHSILAQKIRDRVNNGLMACDIPMGGDRVDFVVVMGPRTTKLALRGEDPGYQQLHPDKYKIDREYYAEKLRDALCRMTDCVFPLKHHFQNTIRSLPTFRDENQPSIQDFFMKEPPVAVVNVKKIKPEQPKKPLLKKKIKQTLSSDFFVVKVKVKRKEDEVDKVDKIDKSKSTTKEKRPKKKKKTQAKLNWLLKK